MVDTDATAQELLLHLAKENVSFITYEAALTIQSGKVTCIPLNRMQPKTVTITGNQDVLPLLEKINFQEEHRLAFAHVCCCCCWILPFPILNCLKNNNLLINENDLFWSTLRCNVLITRGVLLDMTWRFRSSVAPMLPVTWRWQQLLQRSTKSIVLPWRATRYVFATLLHYCLSLHHYCLLRILTTIRLNARVSSLEVSEKTKCPVWHARRWAESFMSKLILQAIRDVGEQLSKLSSKMDKSKSAVSSIDHDITQVWERASSIFCS